MQHAKTFVANPFLGNFVGTLFFMQIDILVLNLFVRIIFFENETNFSINYFKNQVKF